jgi:hypothetical protein
MGGTFSTYGWEDIAYRILVGKREVKRPLGRPKHGRRDNTGAEVEVERESMDWISMAWEKDNWHALVKMVLNLLIP